MKVALGRARTVRITARGAGARGHMPGAGDRGGRIPQGFPSSPGRGKREEIMSFSNQPTDALVP